MDITDLTAGTYRRQYSGFIFGDKINSVSMPAEAWFWRIHAIADDFGNLSAAPEWVYLKAIGKRLTTLSLETATKYTAELEAAGLIIRYTARGGDYFHIFGWDEMQTAKINGKRARMVPGMPENEPEEESTAEDDHKREKKVNPGESRLNRVNPGESGLHNNNNNNKQDNKARAGFECTDGVYELQPEELETLTERFPELEIKAEYENAAAYLETNPRSRQSTADARGWFIRWLDRSNRVPRYRATETRRQQSKTVEDKTRELLAS